MLDRLDKLEHFKRMCEKYRVEVDIKRLKEIGFFTVPSSISHHSAYEGGNYNHSRTVAEFLIDMTEADKIEWQKPRSPWVVGIFHDICKCDNYISVMCEDNTEKWDYNDAELLSGHGEKSIMMLSQFLKLTEEEVLCIRYHMGAYKKEDWEGFDRAIKKYPAVLWTHTADMYASKIIEV